MGFSGGSFLKFFAVLLCLSSIAQASDHESIWQSNVVIPPGGRNNLYQLSSTELQESIKRGKIHTQIYPVDVTGLLPPLRPVKNFFENENTNPFKFILQKFFKGVSGIKHFNDAFRWMGLHDYPKEVDEGVYSVPYPDGQRPDYLLGFGVIKRNGVDGFSVSCASCHSSNLFGKTVLGMTNRFSKANLIFLKAKKFEPFLNPELFRVYNKATPTETAMLVELKKNLQAVAVKAPLVLGLDTSLAQVALSLNKRNADPWATYNAQFEAHPRPDILDTEPGDSKPAVWWNLKYKNRWLSDGSIVSGNPVFTNILWNEIGRGADLVKLDQWLKNSSEKIMDLTNAVFSMESPRITDFFPAENINIERAQRGEKIFNQHCAKCHGMYIKNWSEQGFETLPYVEQIKTKLVVYTNTKVVDVGTDSARREKMQSLFKMNDLEISKNNQTLIIPQKGYVAPPLVGIWARWPYLHNNSVPSLCAVLTPGNMRPSRYYAVEAIDPQKDFDFDCNGYPYQEERGVLYDTSQVGMNNTGHDERIFIKDGQELLSANDKKDLIQFLQTL